MSTVHLCHAKRCPVPVPRNALMCLRHWRMVPKNLQRDVWRVYLPGQEQGTAPVTDEYLKAARAAIDWVSNAEEPDPEPVQKLF